MAKARDEFVNLETGVTLRTRRWQGGRRPFVLLHGLSSNCLTWEGVARRLADAGHAVVTVDQRGHGLSDKPDSGYDFVSVTADLAALIGQLNLHRPIVAGQSWGGNVVLEFGARYPGLAWGLCFVDGGFLDLQSRPGATWETISTQLRPPDLSGTHLDTLRERIRQANPTWSRQGMEATLANFEPLADGTVLRRLSIPHHMIILRALWEQRPSRLFAQVREPVLICPASSGDADWTAMKRLQVEAAQTSLAHAEVHWFQDTHHDIHIHRPEQLADLMLESATTGIWRDDHPK